MTFRGKQWESNGNHYTLVGTEIRVYQWNTGKNANFMVTAGFSSYHHIEKTIPGKGQAARDAAIEYALSIQDKYRKE